MGHVSINRKFCVPQYAKSHLAIRLINSSLRNLLHKVVSDFAGRKIFIGLTTKPASTQSRIRF